MNAATSTQALRVLIADDHAPTRDDVRRALANGGLVVCAEAADAARAVQQALATKPDICLLDVRMPGGGVAAAWEIAARLPTTKVVMLTVSDEDGDLFRALRAGAVSYLVKDLDLGTLPQTLLDVAEGKAAIPPELVARMVTQFHSNDPRFRTTVLERQALCALELRYHGVQACRACAGWPLVDRKWLPSRKLQRRRARRSACD